MPRVQGDIDIALAGDSLICHRLSVHDDPGLLALADLFRSADVAFTNAECLFLDGNEPPAYIGGGGRDGTYMGSPAYCIDELRWLGIKLVSCANNHATDFGESGLLANIKNLDARGMTHAGTGLTLTEASAPAYLETSRGRIALIAAADWGSRGLGDLPYPVPIGVIAGDPGSSYQVGRPGVNLLRFDVVVKVSGQVLDALRVAGRELKWDETKAARRDGGGARDVTLIGTKLVGGEVDTDDAYHFMGTKFVRSETFSFETVPYQDDLERNYKWIREARRQADWVIVSFHDHGASRSRDEVPDHTRIFARGAIEQGADLFVAHGGIRESSVELWRGKPIVYGVRPLLTQNSQVTKVPNDSMERWGLGGHEHTPADYHQMREGIAVGATPGSGVRLESAVVTVRFRGKALKDVRIHPTELGWRSLARSQQGRPGLLPPDHEAAKKILERLQKLCGARGTELKIAAGVGLIEPNAP